MFMPLSVKNQSIESSGITKDYKDAICEYIWNGYEAKATEVRISYTLNQLEGIDTITISDNGEGINYETLSETFGAFLASQKNSLSLKVKSKANKGKGRFSFIAFSAIAQWCTKYKDNESIKGYSIVLTDANKESFEYEEPQVLGCNETTGTTVTFYNVDNLHPVDFSLEQLEDSLLSEFAWYLYLNKHKPVKLFVNDQEIDYNKRIDSALSETTSIAIDDYTFKISLIVWNERIKEKFCSYYFDSQNQIKGSDTTNFNRNTVNFNHSVFIESSFFDKWDKVVASDFTEQGSFLHTDDEQKIFKKLRKVVQEIIARKINLYMSGKADEEIKKMIEERKTFPSFPNDAYGELRKKDLINVTKGIYCLEPRIFFRLKEIQEKSLLAFLNLLLNSEERQNVLTVIEQVVQLTTEQRRQFAGLLQKTRLENIIDTISFIENRYYVIEILKEIIFDLEKFTNERDHIQKIIEQNYWLFGEQYHLASADRTMHRALEQYNYLLYGAKDATEKLSDEIEADRRMDIFMSSARRVETSFGRYVEENIIVELKAPRVPLSKTVLRQVEDYMDIIRNNPQFNSRQRIWKFIAVCKEVDENIKARYNAFKDRGKPGLVHVNDNYEIYALTWDDVFTEFELRHSFMLEKLQYNRSVLLEEMKLEQEPSREKVDQLTEMAIAQ